MSLPNQEDIKIGQRWSIKYTGKPKICEITGGMPFYWKTIMKGVIYKDRYSFDDPLFTYIMLCGQERPEF